jgi:hypothetical protein
MPIWIVRFAPQAENAEEPILFVEQNAQFYGGDWTRRREDAMEYPFKILAWPATLIKPAGYENAEIVADKRRTTW